MIRNIRKQGILFSKRRDNMKNMIDTTLSKLNEIIKLNEKKFKVYLSQIMKEFLNMQNVAWKANNTLKYVAIYISIDHLYLQLETKKVIIPIADIVSVHKYLNGSLEILLKDHAKVILFIQKENHFSSNKDKLSQFTFVNFQQTSPL